jgi:hypothetical protein
MIHDRSTQISPHNTVVIGSVLANMITRLFLIYNWKNSYKYGASRTLQGAVLGSEKKHRTSWHLVAIKALCGHHLLWQEFFFSLACNTFGSILLCS